MAICYVRSRARFRNAARCGKCEGFYEGDHQHQQAPAAIGPYSQGVRGAGIIITSGQLPIDPATGAFAGDGIAEQTRQSLKNVQAVLEAGGSSLGNVLKTTVFLKNMDDFAAMNEVYATFF